MELDPLYVEVIVARYEKFSDEGRSPSWKYGSGFSS
jgi:hypothetical protein